MTGRPPKPTALKVLHGTVRPDRVNAAEPRPVPRLPRAPDELSEAAKREWRATGRQLVGLGLMTAIDKAQLATYCQNYTRWLEVTALLGKSQVLLKVDGRIMINPLLRVARDLEEQFTRALIQFGMSPTSRARVHAVPVVKNDPLEEFVGRRLPG